MKRYQRISGVIAGFLFMFGIAASMIAAGAYYYVAADLPDVDALRRVQLQVPMRIYTRDGRLVGEFGEYRRIPLRLEQIPAAAIDAFLAAEDDRFFNHPGVDYQGLARAVLSLALTGEKRQGGSTITMQVARNYLLTREKTYERKVREIFLALRIESELEKPEILTLYLNKIFLGQRAYGVGAAAEVYYGKTVDALTLAEIATIAGLPQAPSLDNPVTSPERAKARRSYVLRRMLELGTIDDEARQAALVEPIATTLHGPTVEVEAPYMAEVIRQEMLRRFREEDIYTAGFSVTTTLDSRLQAAANEAIRGGLLDYDRRHGYRGPAGHVDWPGEPASRDDGHTGPEAAGELPGWDDLIRDYPRVGGLVPALVHEVSEQEATLYVQGSGLELLAWESMRWARPYINDDQVGPQPETAGDILDAGDIVYLGWLDEGGRRLAQIPVVQGALVAADPQDGAIVALTGGFDFRASKFNRAVQARRQPGSAFKPFIYSAALEGGFTLATIVNDAPLVRRDPVLEDVWAPKNSSGRFYGERRLRDALVFSMNLATVRVMDELIRRVGIRAIVSHIAQFGFPTSALPHDLSLALGSAGVTPVQMAAAYASFANGGYSVTPYFIQRIHGSRGKTIYEADPRTVCEPCLEQLVPESDGSGPEIQLATEFARPPELIDTIEGSSGEETVSEESTRAEEYDYSAYFAERIITNQNAYLVTDMMRDVIRRGTGRRARFLERADLAGKTGTTNDRRDAWFAGFNGDVVTAAWVGFDQERPLGAREEGAHTALPMWIQFMDQTLNTLKVPENRMAQPPEIITVRIDPTTGKRAGATDPGAIFEIFRPQYVPLARVGSGTMSPEEYPEDENPEEPPLF